MISKLLTTITGGLLVFGFLVLWQTREVSVAEAVDAPPITQGDDAAPHRIVSILSPTCSHCAEHETQTAAMFDEAVEAGKLQHIIYPVTTSKGSEPYTHGFICAARQGRFGAYAEAHYEAYFGRDERPDAAAAARSAGLEMTAFERCVTSPDVAEEAVESLAWAKQLGAAATPTFFVYLPESDRWQRLAGQRRGTYWETWLSSGG